MARPLFRAWPHETKECCIKNILLLVHEDEGQKARLQVALGVTRALGAQLECLEARELPMLMMGTYGDSAKAMALFGGVTRTMLETAVVPLLLPHWTVNEKGPAISCGDCQPLPSRRANPVSR